MLESQAMKPNLYGEAYARVQTRDIPRTLCQMMDRYFAIQPLDRILEVGVGSGNLLAYLYGRGVNTVGVDVNEWLLRSSRNPNTVIGDATKLPFRNESFDRTISVHTLEHISDLQGTFQELDRVTVEGGLSFNIFPAFFITKAEGAIIETLRMYPFNPVRAWREAHRIHVHNLNPEKISDLIKLTHFQLTFAKKIFVLETKGTNWVMVLKK